jgi:hypothetical protein
MKLDTNNLQTKIDLVKNDMFYRFPNCRHTVTIVLWDDETDSVECRYGTDDKIYTSRYYNNKLIFEETDIKNTSGDMMIDKYGTEYYPKPRVV